MIPVKKDTIVSFRYVMKNGQDEVLENSMEGTPTVYLHGSDGIHVYLQKQLEGLVAGNKKHVTLLKSSGLTNDDFSFDVIIDGVRDALAEELMLGYPVLPPANVCEADCDCYD